ncbi:glycoprotein [Oxbow virus]|uniref:Envelopment polyprotein n=1 Tax=Oxbow virus TaxID=660954 RepID=C7AGW1_9VIRU|nr:glycoprotein [Oxbow virus]ACT68338.1 glycoprotein [Oxbow virus]
MNHWCNGIGIITSLFLIMGLQARGVYELYLECPHAITFGESTLHGTVLLPPLPLHMAGTLEVESSCSMDVHNSLTTATTYTQLNWAKKPEHTGSASSTSFNVQSTQITLKGTCILGHKILEQAYKLRKSIVCYDLICNLTSCKIELHYLSPVHACTLMKTCLVAVGPYRVQIIFRKTFCSTGIIVEGRCFRPDRTIAGNTKYGLFEIVTLTVQCFLIAKEDERLKVMEEFEKQYPNGCQTGSNQHKFQGYYICIIGGSSDIIRVPNENDPRAMQIFNAMFYSPYGEDHDSNGEDISALRLAGPAEAKVPNTESVANFHGIAFSGSAMYSSLSVFTISKEPKYVFSPGIIPNVNQSTCDKKALPLLWSGLTKIPGIFEPINRCNVFCVLSGPGASCEAFAEGGIYNLTSPTCLVSRYNAFRSTEQQVTFVCQRVDMDIVVYCNGYKKVILTKTLIIGQCIYTITSVFSIFSGIAHSIAVELCVPGFHGWATVTLVVTFCFGWLLIPALTWFIIVTLKFLTVLFYNQSEQSKFKALLRRIKEEYERTKGSMVCEICKLECETQKELKAHRTSCPNEQCPYCFVHCEPVESAFQAHYSVCKVTHRFSDELKSIVQKDANNNTIYRNLSLFRYKSRCYIFTVWLFLLLIESLFWAASAQPEPLKTTWSDNAHGIGKVSMKNDLELDFSLTSNSKYTYQRDLINPHEPTQGASFHLEIFQQVVVADVQFLGHWYDGRLNIKTSFHCYGECKKYTYPWQTAYCKHEFDYQYENGWACNPPDCPGVGTGCTACGLYVDKLKAVGTAYRIINLKYVRKICIQLNEEHICRDVESNDCFVTNTFKICIIGTVSKFLQGDTIVFLGPLEGGGLVLKQWCTTNCQFGDPGDIMRLTGTGFICPEYTGQFRKKCAFAHTPICEYHGNMVSGYKKLKATIDSFQSFNTSNIHYTNNRMEWSDPDGLLRDHINVMVSRDLDFVDLSQNPCKISLSTTSIEGAWGSGVGFTLKCTVSLTECSKFITTVKACDSAICYGASSCVLTRGQNTVYVTGKGGHSGSRFKCCHKDKCADDGLLGNAPHLDRVNGIDTEEDNHIFDDGSPSCGISCWFVKTGEWLKGLFHGNWLVIVALLVLLLISLVGMSFLCPVKKIKRI